MPKLLFAITALSVMAANAHAQSLERQIQSLINADGHSCAQVTHLEPAAKIEDGDWLLGAACSDGNKWLIRFSSSNQPKKVLRCWLFAAHVPFCQ
jgi:hypothetical protein